MTDGTKETLKSITDWFERNREVFVGCVEDLDDFNGWLGDYRWHDMDEFDGMMRSLTPTEIVDSLDLHCFDTGDLYFVYTDLYGYVSGDSKDYSGLLEDSTMMEFLRHRERLAIADHRELDRLFDELEESMYGTAEPVYDVDEGPGPKEEKE